MTVLFQFFILYKIYMESFGFKFRSNDFFKSPVDIILSILFILYIILPIQFPDSINAFLISPIGLFFIIVMMFVFFMYNSVIVGVLFIFVAFLMMHRISNGVMTVYEVAASLPTQKERDNDMLLMNPPEGQITLEEEIVVKTVTPITSNSMENFMESSFKPVYTDSKMDYAKFD